MMSPSATNPDLTKAGSKVFNRLVFTDAFQGKSAAEYLFNTLKFTKLAIIHDGQAYGQGLAQVVNDTFKGLGGEVVAFQAITPGESDYTAILADIASKKPQAIFFGGYVAEGVVLVNEMLGRVTRLPHVCQEFLRAGAGHLARRDTGDEVSKILRGQFRVLRHRLCIR